MRLRELRLLAYGPFSDTALDFGDSGARLHVIYGPNEAGKSTALRAITSLLYGIPARTVDAHVHANKKLRIGGVIENGAGEHLTVVRRKGLKRTLLGPDEAAIDEAPLLRALGGVSRTLFTTMFGLDHVTLREGAQALLRGDGDVGESLFDAGGARGIGRVLDALRDEAEALYKPRGQTPALNDALRRFKEAKQRIMLKEMLPDAWTKQKQATEEAMRDYERFSETRQRLGAERSRLQRAMRAFPELGRRREIMQRLERLGDVPRLSPTAREERLAAQHERDVSGRRAAQLRAEIAALAEEKRALVVDEELAELDEMVMRDVSDRLGNHRKAQADLPKREAAWRERRKDAAKLLEDLGRDITLEQARLLRLDKPARARIESLRGAHGRMAAELESAEQAHDESRARLEALRARIAEMPAPIDDLAARRARVAQTIRDADTHDTLRAALAADEAALERRRQDVATELAELKHLGAPSMGELAAARETRDAHWQRIAGDLAGASKDDIARFEEAVAASDAVADRLWQQADRVAKNARLSAEEERIQGELAALTERRAELGDGVPRAQIEKEAEELARDEEHERRRRALADKAADLEESLAVLETRVRAKREAIATWKADWREAVQPLGLGEEATVEAVAAAEAVLSDLFTRLREADELERRIEGIRRDAEQFEEIVMPLVARYAPELENESLDRAAEELVKVHQRCVAAARRRDEVSEAIDEKKALLAEVELKLGEADDKISDLMRAAGVAQEAELEDVEERAADRAQLERRLEEAEKALFEEGSIDELVELTRNLNVDETRARLMDLEDEHREVIERCEQLSATIGANERGLEELERREGAVTAAAAREETLASIRRLAGRYARVRLAAIVLEREIERYRKHNQGPILARAGELFPRLTLGRYTELAVGFDDRDEPALRCTRATGEEVDVAGLSDGTRDQLYLALRLASLERYGQRSDLLPFVVDDILIHFDDERARAALTVLAEFATKTQVLFFTHHQRLVELARELGPDRVQHHRLPDPAARV